MCPTCSPVLALTLTAPSSTPSNRARFRANRRLVRAKLRFLSMDDQIAIDGPKSSSVNLVDDLRQEAGAIESGPLWIGIGIMFPNITQAGCPQQRISHSVANHVCVGMPHEPTRMGNPNTSQDERPSFTQPMRVVPDPNPHVKRLRLLASDGPMPIEYLTSVQQES